MPEKKPRVPVVVPIELRIKPTLPIHLLNIPISIQKKPRVPMFQEDKSRMIKKDMAPDISFDSKNSKEMRNFITQRVP